MRFGPLRVLLLASLALTACKDNDAPNPPPQDMDARVLPDVGFFGDSGLDSGQGTRDAGVDPRDGGGQTGDGAVANDGGPNPNDGGPNPNDGGPNPNDGGPNPNDGGPNPNDGGSNPNDGGPNPNDGGPNQNDGGPNPNDGGPNPNDGGPNPNDGGPNPNDGGPNPNDGGPNPNDGGPNPNDGGPVDVGPVDAGTLALTPTSTVIPMGNSIRFGVNAPQGVTPQWAVNGAVGGGTVLGTIVPEADPRTAVYTAPRVSGTPAPGSYEVTAAAVGETARATVDLAYVAPTIAAVTPTSVDVGQAGVVFTITGRGFTAQTEVYLSGLRIAPTSVQWTQMTLAVAPTLLTFPGSREIEVRNPLPGGGQDAAPITVVLRRAILPATVPNDVPPLFTGATVATTPALRPAITYPEPDSYAPRDFPAPNVSFAAAANHNICRLQVTGPAVALEIFAPTTGLGMFENPSAVIDNATWGLIFATTQSIVFDFTVTCGQVTTNGGTSTLANNTIYESTTVTYNIQSQAAGGRIVYFSGLIEGLWRIELGGLNPQGTPWIGPSPAFQFQTPACVGCHSLAPSGTQMSVTSGQSEFEVFNTNAGNPTVSTPLVATNGAEWSAIHPSGRFVVGVTLAGTLVLYNAQTGAVIGPVPTAITARTFHTQPFWSPQGDALLFVASNTQGGGVHDVFAGEIWSVPFTPGTAPAAPTFGTPTLLVASAAGQNNFYPAMSPDGQWIVFCRAPNGPSFNNANASLQLVRANGQGGVVSLGRANQTRPSNFNSWPRWSPSVDQGRYWIVYSSQRPYPPLIGTGPQQLWVTQFDSNLLPADPSSPGIWLPGQAPFTGNLTAEWSISQ